jgi:hypothetical protein
MAGPENLTPTSSQERIAEELYALPYDGMSAKELTQIRLMALQRGEAWKIEDISLYALKRHDELRAELREREVTAAQFAHVAADCNRSLNERRNLIGGDK